METMTATAQLLARDGSVLGVGTANLNGYDPSGVVDSPWGGTFYCESAGIAASIFRAAPQSIRFVGDRVGKVVATTVGDKCITLQGVGTRPF